MHFLAQLSARSIRRRGLLALVLLCVAGFTQAQAVADGAAADPPSRVARLAYLTGDLAFLPAGTTDRSDASINRPLTTGDRLSTSNRARAELEFGGGTLRMDDQTEIGLLDLNDQLAQIELTRGTLNLSVRALDDGQSYEIDTPTVALVIDRPGSYRLDVDGDDTRVTVFDGSATAYGDNNAQRTVNAGRSYRFADSSLAAVSIDNIADDDAFDTWSRHRDQRYASSTSQQYVDDDVVGYQDLDHYGNWQTSDDYGEVWYPDQVAADWAPYRDGHWAYIAPWGWTWVDDAPWGFAPYHYGRWAHTRRGWGWIPGPRGVRSIYAPALVAFVGDGRWSAGIGGSPVGWFPLGPGDIYSPWYHASQRYFTNVNLRNMRGRHGHDRRAEIDARYNHYRHGTAIPDRHDRDHSAPRGFTAVPGKTFIDGGRVQRDHMRIDPRQLVGVSVLPRGASQLRPIERDSGGVGGARPDRVSRSVVTRHEPPPIALNRGRESSTDTSSTARITDRTGGSRRSSDRFSSHSADPADVDDTTPTMGRERTLSPRPPRLNDARNSLGDNHHESILRSGNRDAAVDRGQPWMRSRNLTRPSRTNQPADLTRDQTGDRQPDMRRMAPMQEPRSQRAPESRMTIMREQPRRLSAPPVNYRPSAPMTRSDSSYQPPPRATRPSSESPPSRGSARPSWKSGTDRRERRDGR